MLPPGHFFARVGVSSFAEGVYADKEKRATAHRDLPQQPKPEDGSDARAQCLQQPNGWPLFR